MCLDRYTDRQTDNLERPSQMYRGDSQSCENCLQRIYVREQVTDRDVHVCKRAWG